MVGQIVVVVVVFVVVVMLVVVCLVLVVYLAVSIQWKQASQGGRCVLHNAIATLL